MAEALLMRRTMAGHLAPADDRSREALLRLPRDKALKVTVSQPRNLEHHGKFFAMIKLIFDNQSHYKTQDDLLVAIKVFVGHYDTLHLKEGTPVVVPKSISFAKMDQQAFNEFYDRCLDVVCQKIIPNLNPGDLRRELESFAA